MENTKTQESLAEESKMSFYDKSVILKTHSTDEENMKTKIENKSYSEIEDEDEIDQSNFNNIFPVDQISHGCNVFSDMIITAAHTIQDTFHDALIEDGDALPSVVTPNSSSSGGVEPHNLTVWETACEVATFMMEAAQETVHIAEENLEIVSENFGPSISNVRFDYLDFSLFFD